MTTPTEMEDMRLRMEHFERQVTALRAGTCTCGLVKHFLTDGTHVSDCAHLVHQRIRAEALAQHKSAHRALVSDNAALLRTIQLAGEALEHGEFVSLTVGGPHPGTALLSEMEALRKRVAELEASAATARDAALEEAAEEARRWNGEAAKRRILALATTPPTHSVPVSTVREAATSIASESAAYAEAEPHHTPTRAEWRGRIAGVVQLAGRLGVVLDDVREVEP